jgi:hypothetical protein
LERRRRTSDMYIITVRDHDNTISFKFNNFTPARDFADICYEVCDDDVQVVLSKNENEKEDE